MKNYLMISVLVGFLCGAPGCSGAERYNTQALAGVVKYELERLNVRDGDPVCLSLPGYKDPSERLLERINGRKLRLLRGTSCWRSPKGPTGFHLIVKDYREINGRHIEVTMEVDDLHLNGAHVGTRLRDTKYKMRLNGANWSIESSQAMQGN